MVGFVKSLVPVGGSSAAKLEGIPRRTHAETKTADAGTSRGHLARKSSRLQPWSQDHQFEHSEVLGFELRSDLDYDLPGLTRDWCPRRGHFTFGAAFLRAVLVRAGDVQRQRPQVQVGA
jgi:hypothetical protein